MAASTSWWRRHRRRRARRPAGRAPGQVHAFGGHRDSAAEALIIITPGVERFDYFRHVARWREAREPRDILLGLQDRFDTHFTGSATWDRARTAR